MWPFAKKKYRTVSVTEARQLVRSGATLIDVRTRQEWNGGHAREARHIPLDALEQKLSSLRPGTPVVAICQSGMRSASAARMLAARGYEVSSVSGGMAAWNRMLSNGGSR
jgi:rhodanese-related sulfurtransferase